MKAISMKVEEFKGKGLESRRRRYGAGQTSALTLCYSTNSPSCECSKWAVWRLLYSQLFYRIGIIESVTEIGLERLMVGLGK